MSARGTELRLTRRLAAPRERVFDAWTDPEVLRRWWASMPGWTTPSAQVDLRVGGRYRLAMQEVGGGAVHAVVGEYTEVRRPERLAYTWTWEGHPPEMAGSEGTLVVVDFVAEGDGTEVVITHTGFADEGIRGMHAHGWNAVMDNLERRGLDPA